MKSFAFPNSLGNAEWVMGKDPTTQSSAGKEQEGATSAEPVSGVKVSIAKTRRAAESGKPKLVDPVTGFAM